MDWTTLLLGIAVGVLLAVPVAAVWSRRTIRRVRHLERRARTAERLAEVGALTSGLAHEIKNPLSTINLNAQLLQEDLVDLRAGLTEGVSQAMPGAGGQSPDLLDQIQRLDRRFGTVRREAQRLRDILEDFLRFAGRIKLDRVPTDLRALVDELADFFEPQARAAGIRLRRQYAEAGADDELVASVDPGLIKQAMLNLLINAVQAMTEARETGEPNGGADELILRIERARHLGTEELHLHVTDTGPGISENDLPQIFAPYFTTKRSGTGLGLPTARRIAEEHGGRLLVHPAPAQGTDFALALPTTAATSATSAEEMGVK